MDRAQFAALLHGPAYPALRKQLSGKQWQRLVREARRRGTTVQGIASGLPAALTPMTRRGIRRQAASTINSIYAPIEAQYDSDEARIRGLDEKRRIDNQHYAEWLRVQHDKMRTDARAADAAFLKTQEDIQSGVDQVYMEAQQGARARAEAAAGNVSDPNQSLALDFAPERQRAAETVAAQRQRSAQQVATGEKSSDFLATASSLHSAAQDQKRQSDTQSALKGVAEERNKARLSKAADTAKEAARLLDQEIVKAQSNREFDVAREKLLGDRAELAFQMRRFGKEFGLEKSKFKHEMSQDQIKNRLNEIKVQLESGRLSETQRHNLASERLRLLDIRTGGGKQKKGKDTTAWRQYRGLIGKAKAFGAKPGRGGKIQRALLLEDGNFDPLLVQAAVQVAIRGSVDPELAHQIKKLYRFSVPTSGTGSIQPQTGSPVG